jgi:hypothetical protein
VPVVWPRKGHRGHRRLRDVTAVVGWGREEADNPLSNAAYVAGLRPISSGALEIGRPWPADQIIGTSPTGDPLRVVLGEHERTLLVFLATQCDGCQTFWEGLTGEEPPVVPELATSGILAADLTTDLTTELTTDVPTDLTTDLTYVVITRSPPHAHGGEVARLSEGVRYPSVVMSDQAWDDFCVTGYPFFVLLDGPSRSVVGETVGFGWADVRSMVSAAG